MTVHFDPADVERFRVMVERHLGLHYDDAKSDFLTDVLRHRMTAVSSHCFAAYTSRFGAATRSDELRALAAQLTVNETFFFRNADQLRAFTEAAVPACMEANARDRRLRILSAGCASGEEPFSLAILLRDTVPELATWQVTLVGIDISRPALAKARAGRYSAWSLRATPDDIRQRWFTQDGRELVLDPAIRDMVTFEERNLVDEAPAFWQANAFDIIFCRNVLMYFTVERARDVVCRLRQALAPGGFLFLGHAESLRGLSQGFDLCHTHDTFYYRVPCDPGPGEDRLPAASPLPPRPSPPELAPDAGDVTWFEAIEQSAVRIAALVAARRRTEQAPLPETTTQPRSIAAELVRVMESIRRERFADALAHLSSLAPEHHADPTVILIRAALFANDGRRREAEALCEELLALDASNADAHYLIALCREHDGDLTGAVAHDEAAILLDSTFAMPHLHLGLMAKRRGDRDGARRRIGHALLLLAREDDARLLLFGGGFSRELLLQFCRTELNVAIEG